MATFNLKQSLVTGLSSFLDLVMDTKDKEPDHPPPSAAAQPIPPQHHPEEEEKNPEIPIVSPPSPPPPTYYAADSSPLMLEDTGLTAEDFMDAPEEEEVPPSPSAYALPTTRTTSPITEDGGVAGFVEPPMFYKDYADSGVHGTHMVNTVQNQDPVMSPQRIGDIYVHPEEPLFRETGCVQVEDIPTAELALLSSDRERAAPDENPRRRFTVRGISWRHNTTPGRTKLEDYPFSSAIEPGVFVSSASPSSTPEYDPASEARIRLADLMECIHEPTKRNSNQWETPSSAEEETDAYEVRAFVPAATHRVPASGQACFEQLDQGKTGCKVFRITYDDGSEAPYVDPEHYARRLCGVRSKEGWLLDCTVSLISSENTALEITLEDVEGAEWTVCEHAGLVLQSWWNTVHEKGWLAAEQGYCLQYMQTRMRSLLLKNVPRGYLPRTQTWALWLAGRKKEYLQRLVASARPSMVLLYRTFPLTVLLSHYANPVPAGSYRKLRQQTMRALHESTSQYVRMEADAWKTIQQESEPLMRTNTLENIVVRIRRFDGRPFASGTRPEFHLLLRLHFRECTDEQHVLLPDEVELFFSLFLFLLPHVMFFPSFRCKK